MMKDQSSIDRVCVCLCLASVSVCLSMPCLGNFICHHRRAVSSGSLSCLSHTSHHHHISPSHSYRYIGLEWMNASAVVAVARFFFFFFFFVESILAPDSINIDRLVLLLFVKCSVQKQIKLCNVNKTNRPKERREETNERKKERA